MVDLSSETQELQPRHEAVETPKSVGLESTCSIEKPSNSKCSKILRQFSIPRTQLPIVWRPRVRTCAHHPLCTPLLTSTLSPGPPPSSPTRRVIVPCAPEQLPFPPPSLTRNSSVQWCKLNGKPRCGLKKGKPMKLGVTHHPWFSQEAFH